MALIDISRCWDGTKERSVRVWAALMPLRQRPTRLRPPRPWQGHPRTSHGRLPYEARPFGRGAEPARHHQPDQARRPTKADFCAAAATDATNNVAAKVIAETTVAWIGGALPSPLCQGRPVQEPPASLSASTGP